MLTPTPLTAKAKQIKSIGEVKMNQKLKITEFGWPIEETMSSGAS